MQELEIFKNEEFGGIRTVVIENEPWFVGKDIAFVLGYSNSRKAIIDHVDDEDKGVTKCDTLGGSQDLTVINESGLYSLILSSKLPTAKKFKRWVTSEVLPTIRKHGAYMTDEKAFDVLHNANGLADLLQQAAEQLKQKDVQIERMKPKALFADAVASSKNSILIGELSKIIKANGYDIGQRRLFSWMRDNGYLMKSGEAYNQPTQKSMDLGLMEIKKSTINNPDGSIRTTTTTKITGKGQVYFVNKFCK
ncbi:MAG: phage antirepressor KilAC domain-containing protein [Lachnospiraceae bacterium]|nr:phage antirepressor KilAC domain-containing protein [Lachnospiraceae bacterium]